jgi:hypothetical protein
MLPNVKNNPELRCTARSRRNGFKQCRNPKAYGSSSVCRYHGANRVKRYGRLNSNYKTGEYTQLAKAETRKRLRQLRDYANIIEECNQAVEEVRRNIPLKFWRMQAEANLKRKIDQLVEEYGVRSDSDQSIAE